MVSFEEVPFDPRMEMSDDGDEPQSSEEMQRELERIQARAHAELGADLRAQLDSDRERLNANAYSIRNQVEVNFELQRITLQLPSGTLLDGQERFERGGPDDEHLRRLIREAIEAHQGLQSVKPKKLIYKRCKFWLVVLATLSFTAAGAKLILDEIRIANLEKGAGRKSDIRDLTNEQKEVLTQAVKRWQGQPPEKVWNSFIEYCDRYNPSLQEQLVMTDSIRQMAPSVTPPWVWSSSRDKADAVWACANAFADAAPSKGESRSRYLYIAVRDYKYNGQKLPLAVAAEIAWIAVGHLYCTWHPKKDA